MPLDLSFAERLRASRYPDAYERLLLDVVRGNPTLFMRRDEVEAAWRWIDPILRRLGASRRWRRKPYAAGSWGPSAATALIERDGRTWHEDAALIGLRDPVSRDKEGAMHPRIGEVTERIAERSARHAAPLSRPDRAPPAQRGPQRTQLSCANLAHGFAACGAARQGDAERRRQEPTSRIVTAYNDMLSAHQPYERFPDADQGGGARGRRRRRSSPAACRPCATASPRARRAWSCRCSRAT